MLVLNYFAFDEIRLRWALSGAINQVRGTAFVDTNFSDGGDLLCDEKPIAVDDIALLMKILRSTEQ
jgi:hypothetical protein